MSYTITGTFVDTIRDKFLIYTKDERRNIKIFKRPAVYKISYGYEFGKENHSSLINNSIDNIAKHTTKSYDSHCAYRGMKRIYDIYLDNYKDFKKCKFKLHEFVNSKIIFTTFSQDSLEDVNMVHYGLYSSLCLSEVDGNLISQPTGNYEPIVAAYDLEMFTLNGLDPDCNVYLASYVCEGEYHAIYTTNFYKEDIGTINITFENNIKPVSCVRVQSMTRLVDELCKLVYKTRPDVLTGYNIYNADNQLLYRIKNKFIQQLLSDPATDVTPYFINTKKIDKGYVDSSSGFCMCFPGINVIDMYVFLHQTLPSEEKRDMSLKSIAMKKLGDTKDDLNVRDLRNNYDSKELKDKIQSIKYCVKDSILTVRLYKLYNVWNYYRKIEAMTGINQQRILTTSSVTTCYGWITKELRKKGLSLDTPNTPIFKPGGGYVISPKIGLYRNVHCLDGISLYPSIVIAFNICPFTINQYFVSNVEDYHVLYDDQENKVHFYKHYIGIIPTILKQALEERCKVKEELKNFKEDSCRVPLSVMKGEELALKTMSNSLCGAFAEQSQGNPISYCTLNAVITKMGRTILSNVVNYSKYLNPPIEAIYGDTDSIFAIGIDRDLTIKDVNKSLSQLNKILPNGIIFKHEYMAKKFLIASSKHYIYIEDGNDNLNIKGFKGVKSSSCIAGSNLFYKSCRILLEMGLEACEKFITQYIENIRKSPDIKDLELKLRFRGKDYAKSSCIYQQFENFKLRGYSFLPGESLSIIFMTPFYTYYFYKNIGIYIGNDSSKISQRTFLSDEIAKEHYEYIDTSHILHISCLNDLAKIIEISRHNNYINNTQQIIQAESSENNKDIQIQKLH